MPKLGEYKWLLDTNFFLYPSIEYAKRGEKAGGTGFFFALPSERFPDRVHHLYGVTNWHVACTHPGAPVIRVNRRNGPPDIIDLRQEDWHYIVDGYDVAVVPLVLSKTEHRAEAFLPDWILTDDDAARLEIFAGEDVFMLGRFIDYDGIERNEPSMRFGNISMMSVPVRQINGCMRPSIVVDMHSRTGFSGSPVFVYRTPGSIFARTNTIMGGGHLLKLLGVHWGQFQEQWPIREGQESLPRAGRYIVGPSGMTCACPAKSIMEVLYVPALVEARKAEEARQVL